MVIDASVAVKWIVDEPGSDAAREILKTAADSGIWLVAPALVLVEVHYAVAKRFNSGKVTADQLNGTVPFLSRALHQIAVDDLVLAEAAASLSFTVAARQAWQSPPFSVYDCVYLALAQRENLTLVTADQRQASYAASKNIAAQYLG